MNNPFVTAIVAIAMDMKNWIFAVFATIGAARIAFEGLKYKGADESERIEIKRSIKSSLIWFVGMPFVVWLAAYIWQRVSTLAFVNFFVL